MKHIVIIISDALPVPSVKGGAVETLVQFLIDKNELNPTFNITVISIYNSQAADASKNYRHTKFKYIDTGLIKYNFLSLLIKISRRLNITSYPSFYLYKVISIMKKLPCFDMIILENTPSFAIEIRKQFQQTIIQHLHNDYLPNIPNRDKIISSSNEFWGVSNFISERIKKIEPNANVNTLYNCIDICRFNNSISEDLKYSLRKKLGIHSSDKVIIYSGRIQPHKGVLELLKAFKSIQRDNLKLLIIGSSFFSDGLKSDFFCSLKDFVSNDDRVLFTGYIDYIDIHAYYQIADIGVFPSLCNEAFGLTCLESLASGLPTVVTRTGGLPEVADDAGFVIEKDENIVVNLTNIIQYILEMDEDMINQVKLNGIRRSQLFTQEKYWDSFKFLINDII